MQIKAIILESEPGTAKTLLEQIEANLSIKCVVAPNLERAKQLLDCHPKLDYLFCVYDVSSNDEQIREQTIAEYAGEHYPSVQIFSIGTIKKEEVTLTNQKVILIDSDDIKDFGKSAKVRRLRPRRSNLKFKTEAFRKRGINVVY